MVGVLADICADKRIEITRRKAALPLAEVEAAAHEAPPPRGFADRLAQAVASGGYGLIAEIKRASPSKGVIRADFDPAALARAFELGGAACLSVLTDAPYFQGADEDLAAAREASRLPVLRKDFMLDPYQVAEARALGADCILLIMAALDDPTARALAEAAAAFGMDVLAEAHNADEVHRALRLPCRLIGINNRDLNTLTVDLDTTERLAPLVPRERIRVCESGLKTAEDLARMARAGVHCFLVGESLMAGPDVAAATRALLTRPAAPRRARG